MKRTPLRRKSPLRTRSSIKPRATARPRPQGYEDPAYLAWVRTRPCCVGGACFGPIEAHHLRFGARGSALGGHLKDDRRAIPMCRGDHMCLHTLTGPFRYWSRDQLRAWQDRQLAEVRAQYLARGTS